MSRWYQLERPDFSTFTEAPVLYRFPAKFAATPERVWASLVSDESLKAWGVGVKSLRWTSPRPFGIGTTREVVLTGSSMAIREEFFRWDEGKGYSFFVTDLNRRGFRTFAENYEVEPDGDGTLFTWTIAMAPTPRMAALLKALGPVNRLSFGQVVRGGAKYFAKNG